MKGFVYTETAQRIESLETEQTVKEEEEQQKEVEERYWKPSEVFDELTMWQHDFAPHVREYPYLKAMQWLSVSEVLHSCD